MTTFQHKHQSAQPAERKTAALAEEQLAEPSNALPGRGSQLLTDLSVVRTAAQQPASGILAATPHGPVLSGRRAPTRTLHPGTLVPMLSHRDRVLVGLLTAAWLASLVFFWTWWLQPDHWINLTGTILNTALLLYLSLLPVSFLNAMNRLLAVNPAIAVPKLQVAFAVTKAPSEPWPVAKATLEAMISQDYLYPFDVWLCDEDPSAEVYDWCADQGVRISSRHGIAQYHQSHWPRRTKCKEGNLAYFYDTWGYENYDVVVQLDCDHVPEASYLTEMVRPFQDPAVGYVAAPSVCDANAAQSWSARGRLHREGSFQGANQNGHNGSRGPLCIGSHYAVRVAALADIGGVGPELAEDFSTSFLMNSAGWIGAFASQAEAHGDGPLTFSAMVTQEFQWSRSLMAILLNLFPSHVRRLPWKLRLRYAFALAYYPLLALITTVGILLCAVAAVTGKPWVNVNYLGFLLRWCLLSAWLIAIAAFIRSRGLFRPRRAPIVSWEGSLYLLARIPYIVWGVLAAIRQKLVPGEVSFQVTPKQRDELEPLPSRLILPYVLIGVTLSGAAIVGEFSTEMYGYVFLCLVGSLSFTITAVAVPLLHAHEVAVTAGISLRSAVGATAAKAVAVGAAALVPLVIGIVVYPSYVAPVFANLSPIFAAL